MKVINFMKGVWQRMFPIKDITSALNIKTALSDEMINGIELWHKCYVGNAPWIKPDNNLASLKLERSVTREFANIALNEMTSTVNVQKLDDIYKNSIRNLNRNLQRGLATGAMVIKPLGGDKVQYVSANAFIPIEFDSKGRLIKVVFPEYKKLGDRHYTRLEFHSLDYENGLTITNTAYVSSTASNLGREIPLSAVDEWADLEERVTYPLMKRPAFGYYVNPIDNTIDGSHCGISIFEPAIDIIKKADIQFGRIDWEFESAERAIHADEQAFKKNGKIPKLNERLYRAVDLGTDELFKEYSPQLRQADFIAGLEEYKREIEFAVGLSYGDISNPQSVDKTATEIKTSKQRKYNTVTAIQDNLRDCLDDLVYALAFYNSMATSGYKFVCDFKDSILTDESEERKQDQQDLANGTLRPEEYRARWRGEDIETALKNLPQSTEVMD
jgi:A118 family predicted phage portal protein